MSIIVKLLCLESCVAGRNYSTVSRILSYKLLIVLIITVGFALFGGWQQGLSSALGGVAAFIPNLYFALRVYKSEGKPARKIMNAFYAGESGKLLLTAALFIHHLGFLKIVDKNVNRILPMEREKSIFSFIPWKSYITVVFMIALGALLRQSSIPKHYLAVVYISIGLALILSSVRYFRIYFTERQRSEYLK